MVKLKKRLSFKSSVWQESLRVDAIKKAAKFLQNSGENIHVDFDDFENIINEAKNDLINDCEYNLVVNKDVNNERDLDDYSIVSVECESDSTSSNNENGSENNTSKHSSEKDDSDGFIEINDHVDKCPDDETVGIIIK